MKKKFTFFFPMSGETITKEFNLLAVKDATVKYLRKQSEVRGDICLVSDEKGEIVAMAHRRQHEGEVLHRGRQRFRHKSHWGYFP